MTMNKENWGILTNKEIYTYFIWIYKQRGREVDQEIDGKMKWGRMED